MLIPKQAISDICDALYNEEELPSVLFSLAKRDDIITKDNAIDLYTAIDDVDSDVDDWELVALLPTMAFNGDVLYLAYTACPFGSVEEHLHDWYADVNETPVTIRLLYIPKI